VLAAAVVGAFVEPTSVGFVVELGDVLDEAVAGASDETTRVGFVVEPGDVLAAAVVECCVVCAWVDATGVVLVTAGGSRELVMTVDAC